MFPKAIIQNVVSTAQLLDTNKKLDLYTLANIIKNAKYTPDRFLALIIKVKQPLQSTALVFSNGRLVCVGTKSVKESEAAINNFVKIISEASCLSINMRAFEIQNVVSSFAFSVHLNLQALYDTMRIAPPQWLARHISYNPEFFAGNVLKTQRFSCGCSLVFTTGKCIITGARTEEEIYSVQNKIFNSILMFLKN
uniref:TATA-box-binding protein n=1 Tax=Meloidogyne hapla TaxID=6305 RepID=A0A1I8B605_MELHA